MSICKDNGLHGLVRSQHHSRQQPSLCSQPRAEAPRQSIASLGGLEAMVRDCVRKAWVLDQKGGGEVAGYVRGSSQYVCVHLDYVEN